jgi:hypothetical protein
LETLECGGKFIHLDLMVVSQKKATVIISRGEGQLGNRLFQYASFYAASLEKGFRLWNPRSANMPVGFLLWIKICSAAPMGKAPSLGFGGRSADVLHRIKLCGGHGLPVDWWAGFGHHGQP